MSDTKGRLQAVEALLLMMLKGMEGMAPEETQQFITEVCALTRSTIGSRHKIIPFPGLKHALSDDALRYIVRLLESRMTSGDGPEGADAA